VQTLLVVLPAQAEVLGSVLPPSPLEAPASSAVAASESEPPLLLPLLLLLLLPPLLLPPLLLPPLLLPPLLLPLLLLLPLPLPDPPPHAMVSAATAVIHPIERCIEKEAMGSLRGSFPAGLHCERCARAQSARSSGISRGLVRDVGAEKRTVHAT
jgi:corin